MKVHVDQESGVLYFRLDDSRIVESEAVKPGIVLDFSEQKQVVGVEILDAGKRVSEASLKQMCFEVVQKIQAGRYGPSGKGRLSIRQPAPNL